MVVDKNVFRHTDISMMTLDQMILNIGPSWVLPNTPNSFTMLTVRTHRVNIFLHNERHKPYHESNI